MGNLWHRLIQFPRMHRAACKTLTWRIVATTDTFILGFFILGFLNPGSAAAAAGSIAIFEIATKMFLYYFHERLWGKVPHEETTDVH